MCPSSTMCSGSRSSVQNAIRAGPNSRTTRQQRVEVARGRRLADQQPHPGAQALAALLRRVRLVVGADPGRRVRVQLLAEHARRVAVDVRRAVEPELRELALVARDHAGEVHHLGEPDHAPPAQQPFEVARRELAPRRLEPRRRHARRRHHEDVERDLVARVEQPVDAVGAEHVRDLVRVGDDRGRPERAARAARTRRRAASRTRGACARRRSRARPSGRVASSVSRPS